jgi:quercetin dioxygenase-like cupin family protein
VVLDGTATFEVDGETFEAPAGKPMLCPFQGITVAEAKLLLCAVQGRATLVGQLGFALSGDFSSRVD